ncbi:MAG: flavodoxin family protein [Oscillospiraceae bacterium]
MNIAVRYYSKTGNTEKLANAIAEAAGTTAETLGSPLPETTDLLFLGSAVYAAGVDEQVVQFIAGLTPARVKKVVCFSTAALLPSTYNQVKKLLAAQQIPCSEQEFHCRGRFSLLHKSRPNDADLAAAAQFAKDAICQNSL